MIVRPRNPLLNPALSRPNWQSTAPRPEGPMWLDKNENLDPELMEVTAGIMQAIDPACLATYPECAGLYRKLARWLDVPPEALLLTPGSDGAIRLTFEAFIDEGDTVVHTVPTFAMYPVYCQMFGARVEPLVYERGPQGPSLTVERILEHLSRVRPKLFCLPNPDSPTGTALSLEELRAVVDLCERLDTVVLIDEAYHPFYDATCVPWTRDCRHLVVARTFAKAWGLAGLRIGYAVGHPETIHYYHKLRPMYEVGTFSIVFMEHMLDRADAMMASVQRLNDGKRYFAGQMESLGFDVLPTQGNFQHVAFGHRAAAVHRALEPLVLYRREFKDDCLQGYSRFSVTTAEGFVPIVEAIKAVAAVRMEEVK
jgi:histidinol-phosphate aminotransferase